LLPPPPPPLLERRPARSAHAAGRPWWTGTCACATPALTPESQRRLRQARPRGLQTSRRRPTPARTSISSGARCSRASCRSPRTGTARTTSRWVACSRRRCVSWSTASSSGAPSSRCPTGRSRPRSTTTAPRFEVAHRERSLDTQEAMETALERARGRDRRGHGVQGRARQDKPPAPFNTTALMSAASGAGMTPARAMRAAESLYLDGLISYPRTDKPPSTRPSLEPARSLRELARGRPVAATAARLAGRDKASRRRGSRSAPPTIRRSTRCGVPKEGAERRTRQGLRPSSPAASGDAAPGGGHRAPARGHQPRSRAFLPTAPRGDTRLSRGLREVRRQARPPLRRCRRATRSRCSTALGGQGDAAPGRYGQGKLLEKMEELGLGTKATRADIIQHLYDATTCATTPWSPRSWDGASSRV